MLKKLIYFNNLERITMSIILGICSPLVPLIAIDLKVGLNFIGTAISFSAIGLFAISFVAGNLLDILGFKRLIFIGQIIILLGGISLFFSHSFLFFIVSYFILTLGLGIIDIVTLTLVEFISFKNKLKNVLKSSILASIGGIIAPLLVSFILKISLPWQLIYLYIIIPQIVLTIFLLFIKIPEKIKTKNSFSNIFQSNRTIFKKPLFFLYCFLLLLYSALLTTFSTWFTTYFTGINVKLFLSSIYLSIYATSCLLGMVLKNYLINFLNEKKLLLFSIFLSIVFFALIFFTNDMVIKIILIFFFGLNISGIFSIIFTLSLSMCPECSNIASGLLFSFGYLGVIIFQFLVGYLSQYYSKSSIIYIDAILLFFLFILSVVIYFKSKIKIV